MPHVRSDLCFSWFRFSGTGLARNHKPQDFCRWVMTERSLSTTLARPFFVDISGYQWRDEVRACLLNPDSNISEVGGNKGQ